MSRPERRGFERRGRAYKVEVPRGLVDSLATKVMDRLGDPPYIVTVGQVKNLISEVTYFDQEEHREERADVPASELDAAIFKEVHKRIKVSRGEKVEGDEE